MLCNLRLEYFIGKGVGSGVSFITEVGYNNKKIELYNCMYMKYGALSAYTTQIFMKL